MQQASRQALRTTPALETALEILRSYSVPKIRVLLKRLGRPVGGLKPQLIREVRATILDPISGNRLADLVEYLDELQENGRQHLVLFQLGDAHRGYLDRLRDPGYLRGQLRQQGLDEDLLNPASPPFIWSSSAPHLTAVFHRGSPAGVLLLRWVETRQWYKQVRRSVDPRSGAIRIIRERLQERSVNFFRVDLATGRAEIRLQRMRPSPEVALREEVEQYRREIGKLLRLDFFRPVLLEPLIRRLLLDNPVPILDWSIALPEGGILEGKGDPTLAQRLGLPLWRYSALRLSADWPVKRKGKPSKIRCKLDGKTDCLTVVASCSEKEMASLLGEIREPRVEAIENPTLREVAAQHPEWSEIAQKLDSHLSRLQEPILDIAKLVEEEWLPRDQLLAVLEAARALNPSEFQLSYQVLCPTTGRPVRDGGRVLSFRQRSDVPAEVPCQHGGPNKAQSHPTSEHLRAQLTYAPGSGVPPGAGLGAVLRNVAGSTLQGRGGRRAFKVAMVLCFFVIFVPMLWGTTWSFIHLADLHPKLMILIVPPYLIALCLEAGLVLTMLGTKYGKMALEMVKVLLAAAKKLLS